MDRKDTTILLLGIALAIGAGALTFYLQNMPTTSDSQPEKEIPTEQVEKKQPEKETPTEQEQPEKDPNFSQTAAPQAGDLIAEIETTMGTVKLKLFKDKAPKTVENFQLLADKGYYNGIIFHRVISDFMIQTGDPTGTGMGGESAWGGVFDNETSFDLSHLKGAVSMANAGFGTNGSQFFIVQKNGGTGWLDGYANGKLKDCTKPGVSCHTVFGQVFEGLDIVDKIAAVKVGAADKPVEEIKMINVKVYEM